MTSSFAFIDGERTSPLDVQIKPSVPLAAPQAAMAEALGHLQWSYIGANRTPLSNTLMSIPYPGVDVAGNPVFSTADIVHMHWTTWGITPQTVRKWIASGRSLAWTLHDLWAFTGGCHYPAGCEQYRTACLNCPQLKDEWSLVPNAFAEKQAAYGGDGVWVVTPSRWLGEQARESAIFRKARIVTVPNSIETEAFKPHPEREALRAAFGIGPSDLLLLFGSADNSERRKGVKFLTEALTSLGAERALEKHLPPGGEVVVMLFGASGGEIEIPNARVLSLGAVDDDQALADILSLADLTCTPSLEDNYPNVILESLACGVPCVGFAAGGVGEMIRDGVTGLLVREVGDSKALAQGILRFVERHYGDQALRDSCRREVLKNNSMSAVGAELAALYSEMQAARPNKAGHVDGANLRGSVVRAFSRSVARPDATPGAELLRFPLNLSLAKVAAPAARAAQVVASPKTDASKTQVLAVRTHHAHHSAHSGPYQYLRDLPDRFAVTHYATPLGAHLTDHYAATFEAAGRVMGTAAFGQQGNAWMAEAEVAAHCAQQPTDVVHFIDGELGGWLLPSLPANYFANGARPAFVATFHQPPDILETLVNPYVLDRLDAAIVLCESARVHLSRLMDPARVHLIPHGIDTKFFKPAPVSPHPPHDKAFRLLAVGHWLRDYASAMGAFKLLRDRGVAADFTVVSHNFPRRLLTEGVHLVSGLSDAELREQYWSTNCLFLPLEDATANNAILEAMACGVPVVSSNVGGVPDAVADSATLCASGDKVAMADALQRLAEDRPFHAKMAKAARARAETFAWAKIAEAHTDLYDQVRKSKQYA